MVASHVKPVSFIYGGKLMVMIAAVANFPEICPLKKKEHTFA